MTAENVAADQDNIDGQHDGSDADAEAVVEPERLPHVVGQKAPDDVGQPQELAVQILKNQRKTALAPVGFARLANSARGRIGPKRFVISAAVVVAGEAEEARVSRESTGPERTAESRDTTMASDRTRRAASRRKFRANRTARYMGRTCNSAFWKAAQLA